MPRRIAYLAMALAVALSLAAAAHSKRTEDPLFSQINSIVQTLSQITGFAQEHPVAYGWMSKSQLRKFLAKRIKKTLKPDEIYADELGLKMFGLVPQDFDLRKSTIDLLTEQAAAFYDYDTKKLFMLEGSPVDEETTTLAHELSHALADQHFDLERFMDENPANDDENLAHTAVVEGQASWLMLAYDLKEQGQPPAPTAQMLKSIEDSSDQSMTEYPVLKGSPLYIQQSLLFPYTEGSAFFDAVYKKMGEASFSAVFTDAPVDTSQIIHPERYFAHQVSATPELVKLPNGPSEEITEGSLGEFDHRILLRQYLGETEANELAPHLAGGAFKIYRNGHKKTAPALLDYASLWDSRGEAEAFFAAYQKILHKKWKRCDPSVETATVFAGTGDNGYFVCTLAGNKVTSVEGLNEAAEWERLKAEAGRSGAQDQSLAGLRTYAKLLSGACLR